MVILIVSRREAFWNALTPQFTRRSLIVKICGSLDSAIEIIHANAPALVILDNCAENTDDSVQLRQAHVRTTRDALTAVVMANAVVHTAVVTFLDAEAFHDAMEGFGVLCSLPLEPGPDDIDGLAGALVEVRAVGAV